MPARRDTNRPSGVDAVRPSPQEVIVEVALGHTADWMHKVPVNTGRYATFQAKGGTARCFLAPELEVQGSQDAAPYIVHTEIVMAAAGIILGSPIQSPQQLRGIDILAADLGRYDLDRGPTGNCWGITLRSLMKGQIGLTAQTIFNATPGIPISLHR